MSELTSPIDYLVIGTVTRDIAPEEPTGYKAGGTVTFSGRVAQALGCHTAVLTSARPDYDLTPFMAGIEVSVIPSEEDSIFDNIYQGNNRIQVVHGVSGKIGMPDLPAAWQNPAIVHLGPLTNEVDPEFVNAFPDSLVGITPQGWMRRWGDDGRIYARSFAAEQMILEAATATVISEEDLLDDTMLERYIEWANILVMTQNYAGCTVFFNGGVHQVPAPQIELVEPTGAGDIFAGAFFVQLWRNGGDPIQAAEFANKVAAHSVTKAELSEKVVAWHDLD